MTTPKLIHSVAEQGFNLVLSEQEGINFLHCTGCDAVAWDTRTMVSHLYWDHAPGEPRGLTQDVMDSIVKQLENDSKEQFPNYLFIAMDALDSLKRRLKFTRMENMK